MTKTTKLVLVRHGESLWNKKKLFTGWVDIDLSKKGIKEASRAGRLLLKHKFHFDAAYTSVLKRAVNTLDFILAEMDYQWLPVTKAWQLNERHYGGLQGLNKVAMAKKYGAEQVHIWRRSYSTRPPLLKRGSVWDVTKDERYKIYGLVKVPLGESLADTCRRVWPYWQKNLAPELLKGKNLLISAHGNSIRALVKHLDKVSDQDITQVEIPTGAPLVYEFKTIKDQLVKQKKYYLGK